MKQDLQTLKTNEAMVKQSIDEMTYEELPKTSEEFEEWLDSTDKIQKLCKALSGIGVTIKGVDGICDAIVSGLNDLAESEKGDINKAIKRSNKINTLIGKMQSFQKKEFRKWEERLFIGL